MLKLLMDEKKRCPAAEARDYCKLLYQSEFGAGHMTADAQTVLARLRDACAAVKADAESAEAPFTDVGGGLLRLLKRNLKGPSSYLLHKIRYPTPITSAASSTTSSGEGRKVHRRTPAPKKMTARPAKSR